MSEEQTPKNPESAEQVSKFKAFWNKPLKMSDKEIEKLKKKGKEFKQKTVGSEIISWVLTIVTALAIALVLRSFFFEIYGVDGRSMTNTLQDHEKLFCTKLDYLTGQPQRGDVVICHYPGRGNTAFVKRLIAVPGNTIEIKKGFVFVDGKEIAFPEKMNIQPMYDYPLTTLGDDEYFVLGDNRGNSNDSHAVGPITRSMIIAHVRTVIWPLNSIRAVENEFKEITNP